MAYWYKILHVQNVDMTNDNKVLRNTLHNNAYLIIDSLLIVTTFTVTDKVITVKCCNKQKYT